MKELQSKGENFKVSVTERVSEVDATIECQCKTETTLQKFNGKVIPSNFHRYLKSLVCKFVKRLLKEQEDKKNTNNSASNPTVSLSSSSQLSSNNSQLTISPFLPNRKRSTITLFCETKLFFIRDQFFCLLCDVF